MLEEINTIRARSEQRFYAEKVSARTSIRLLQVGRRPPQTHVSYSNGIVALKLGVDGRAAWLQRAPDNRAIALSLVFETLDAKTEIPRLEQDRDLSQLIFRGAQRIPVSCTRARYQSTKPLDYLRLARSARPCRTAYIASSRRLDTQTL